MRQEFKGLVPPQAIVVCSLDRSLALAVEENAWRTRSAELMRAGFIAAMKPDVVFVPADFAGIVDDTVMSIEDGGPPTVVALLDLIPIADQTLASSAAVADAWRNREVSAPLNEVSVTDAANLRLHAGDRVILDRVRRTFTVFGATDRINQIPFESRTLTLAEALARSSGPSDARANPQGVFLFRLQKGADGSLEPVVYRIDMLKADTYFLTQMFKMRDKDVILYANSSSNLAQKMVSLLNLLFSPALTVRYATQ